MIGQTISDIQLERHFKANKPTPFFSPSCLPAGRSEGGNKKGVGLNPENV